MKWDQELKVSGETTEEKFIVKCCPRKNTRNNPESAIATFLAIEEEVNPIGSLVSKFDWQKYCSNR